MGDIFSSKTFVKYIEKKVEEKKKKKREKRIWGYRKSKYTFDIIRLLKYKEENITQKKSLNKTLSNF